jgi:hypothetical protein
MRRSIAAATGLLLLLVLGTQAVLAQYTPAGTLTLSTYSPPAGSTLTVSGTGFAPDSDVHLTIESTPLLLARATTDAAGAFSVAVTIPPSYAGHHSIVATGIDPQGSVRVLASTIEVGSLTGTPVTLSEFIAPGVNRGTSGFGTKSLVVAPHRYITVLVRTSPNLAGSRVQVWVESKTSGWHEVTSRLVAADGTVHYYARVDGSTAYRVKFPGDATHASAASPARIATSR